MVNLVNDVEIKIFPDANRLFEFAAEDFSERAITTVDKKNEFSVVLSGGNTPKAFFDLLTSTEKYRRTIPWGEIKFFFGDERYVPADSPESNYHMALQHLFSKVSVQPQNIFPIPTDFENPDQAALAYAKTLRKTFHLAENGVPEFDLIYLGLGDNAHTASLMPFSKIVAKYAHPTLNAKTSLVEAEYIPELKMTRMTLTPTVINNAKTIIFLVSGKDKADAVNEVLNGEKNPEHYPAQLIHATHGKTIWCLDQAAGEKRKTLHVK